MKKIIKRDRAKGFLGDLLDNMDNQTLSRAEDRLATQIEEAILTTLVVQNKQSIRIAVDKIVGLLNADME